MSRKSREWTVARKKLVKEALISGRIEVVDNTISGLCEDCGEWLALTPDHIRKRSQGGGHEGSNIDWVCIPCHNGRDNEGDPMGKKSRFKKPDWSKPHACIHCKKTTSMIICQHCGNLSWIDRKK